MAVLSIGQMWATDYQLVTSTSDLEAGAKYVIGSAASGSGVFMSTESRNNNRGVTSSITISDSKITGTDGLLVLELGGSTGAWTFLTKNYSGTDGYLGCGTGNKDNHCKINATVTDYCKFTISISDNKAVITSTGRTDRNIMRYNSSNNPPIFACYSSGQNDIYLYKEVTGGDEPTACATPTFSPAAGEVLSGTQVSITCSTEGAAIHYTTDGTNPTASSATYSAAIPVTSEMTIKAIAVKAGLDNSSVASASYTVFTPLTTMDEIFAAAETAASTPTQVAITFNNWVVTGVKNKNVYVTDGTKGFIVFQQDHGFNVGDILSGTAVCKVQLYNGSAELTELIASKVTVNTGGSVSPVVLDAEGIAALTGANTGSVIKISGECTYESSKYYIAGVQLYNQLYSFSVSAGTNYECTGVYVLNTAYGNEILPRSAADIVAQTSVANPTFTPAAGEYTEVQSVTLSCTTEGATVYYTTDGTNPTNESTVYSSAIEVGASMTIKAIAYKGEDHSEVVSAAYTINIPLPSHAFDVTHHFSTGEGFEFPTGWGGSYAEHEITYTDDKVHFASASHQSGTITDRPVVKEGAISLILTNSSKLISAVRFDYIQWSDKVPTLTMKYSTDGGETYSNFDPVVSTTDFALQVLTMPEGVNAIQVVGTANKQTGLTSIAFDLVDKPIVTKTVTITTPENGTLTVMNGEDAVSSGDEIEVNSILTITATPSEGYKLTEVTVNGSAYAEETLTLTENVTIAAIFEENLAPAVETYILSEIGVETSHLVSGMRVGDKVNLPLIAASCSKVFRGWDADPDCDHAPTYAPGAEITLAANNKFYAVYADAHVITPTDHALGSGTFNGTNEGGNTASEGYEFSKSTKGDNKAGYIQDSGTKDATIVFLQIKAESQIINEEPSAIILTAHLGAGSDKDPLDYPVYAVLVDADDNNVGDPVVLTTAIPKAGDDFSVELPTANYADVRGVKISHMKEDGWNVRYYSMSFKYQTGGTTYDNYSTDCQAQVATPVIAGVEADGVYSEGKEISITCATAGATIYYAVDSDDEPTTEYTGVFTVDTDGAHTVKAKAVKTDMVASEIASVSFTINLPVVLSTMDAIFEAATEAGGTATDANIAFGNWVVSGVSTNGKNVFVTDGTKGFIIFDNGASMGFAAGDVLSGTVACKVQLYKGAAELTTLSSATEGLNIATGGSVDPQVKAISALSGINTGAPVTINSVQFDGEYLTDGVNSIKPFNSLFAYDALENGKYYNVTGIYQQFDATKEILPRSAADIEEVNLEDPEISYTPASATIELGQSLPGTTFANPHELAISYSSNNEAVATVSNTGVIALGTETGTAVITASFAGDATYAPANVTYTITVNPASVSQNVVILAVYDTKYYAMSTTNASSAFTAIEVEYDGSKVTVNSEADKTAIQWTRKTSGDNTTFQTKDESPMYMKGTSTGAAMSLNANACNWNWDETNEYYYLGGRSFFYQATGGYFKNFSISDNMGKSGYSGKASVIVIDPANIVITSKVSAELAYNPASDEITEGDAWSAPTLVNPHTVAITSYNSDNEGVATVTDGGVIALAGGIGTAHITAHFAGDATYLEGDAVYTITVNEAGDDLSGTWTLASSVAAGDKIIIANVAVAGELLTMGAQNGSYREEVASTVDGENKLTPAAGTKVFTLVDASSFGSYEGFALQASNGNYLSSASNSSNNIKEVASVSDANAVWSIVISEGVAAIVAQGSYARKVIRYNSGNTRFSCYAESNAMADVVIYKHGAAPEPVLDWVDGRTGLTPGNYYTICLPKKVTAIKGASFWTLKSKSQDGATAYLEEETNNLPFDAGKPFIIQATAEKLEVVYEGDATDVAGTNGALHGTLVYMNATALAAAGSDVYMLFSNELRPVGENNHLDANRAYVKLGELNAVSEAPQSAPGKRVRAMPMQPQVATGIDALNASDAPTKVLINGQLFIIRGEKMFDAKGQLVK